MRRSSLLRTSTIGKPCWTAIFITRLSFEWRLGRKEAITFASSITKDWWKNTKVTFLQKRKMAYIISGIVIAIGVGSLFMNGLNLGVDFVGGRSYQIRFDQSVSTADIGSALEDQFVSAEGEKMRPTVKTIGSVESKGGRFIAGGGRNTA